MVSELPLLSPSNETIKRCAKIKKGEREGERNEDKAPSLSWHDPQRDPGASLGFGVLLSTSPKCNPQPKGEQILLLPAQQQPKSWDPQGTPAGTRALHAQPARRCRP